MLLQIQRAEGVEQTPIRVKICNTFLCRLRGLMFRRVPLWDEALLLIPCSSIHMFFMRFPIDAVFINQEQIVVKVVENVQPWTIVPNVSGAFSTLELPVGTAEQYNLAQGQKLTWK